MDTIPPGKVTALLKDLAADRTAAQNELLHLVHAELRRIAGGIASTRPGSAALSPTELVNEAYIRLFDKESLPDWKNRKHFYCTVALAMRYVVLDDAKSRKAWANGGRARHVQLPEDLAVPAQDPATTLAIDDALSRLHQTREAAAEVFLLEHFAGRSHDQTADILGIPKGTVRRHWDFAIGFLSRELASSSDARESPPR